MSRKRGITESYENHFVCSPLLQELSERPGQLKFHIVPYAAGAYPALGSPFQILSFPSPRVPALVWQEVLTSSDIIDQSARVADYVVTFAETLERALSFDESLALIRQVAQEMA